MAKGTPASFITSPLTSVSFPSTQVCVVCDQPLPPGRADRLTCSARCRTQRSRQAISLRKPTSASQTMRQQLRLASPIYFTLRRPTASPSRPDPELLAVEPECWDQTLEVLNMLHGLHYELGMIASWQGEEGHHPDPITEEGEGNDICGALIQHLANIRKASVKLQEIRGRAGRLLAPASSQLAQQLDELADPVRRLVVLHQALATPYKLAIDRALMQQLRLFQEWVSRWWFILLDQG